MRIEMAFSIRLSQIETMHAPGMRTSRFKLGVLIVDRHSSVAC